MDTLPDDILALIFQNNIGVSTFARVNAVCKTFYRICHSTEGVLCSAALYTGGLTRTDFMGVFALSFAESALFPHDLTERYWVSGQYRLYKEAAVEQVMRSMGGISGWNSRVAAQGRHVRVWDGRRPARFQNTSTRRRKKWVLEEDLHISAARPHLPVGYTVPRIGPTPTIRKTCTHDKPMPFTRKRSPGCNNRTWSCATATVTAVS